MRSMNAIANEIKQSLELDRTIKVNLFEIAKLFNELDPKPTNPDHPF